MAMSKTCLASSLGSRERFPLPTVISFAGLSIPSYTAAVMSWGFTKRQGITILVIATVALIVLIILVVQATSVL
jgi:hypothetical protein